VGESAGTGREVDVAASKSRAGDAGLEGVGECIDDGRGRGDVVPQCEPGDAVWERAVGAADGAAARAGGEPQSPRATADPLKKVEYHLFLCLLALDCTPLFQSG
jgi:hypothetical protein